MGAHRDFFRLTYEELRLGENVPEEVWRQTYQSQGVGCIDSFAGIKGVASSATAKRPIRVAWIGRDTRSDSVG